MGLSGRDVLLAGATGLVGGRVLRGLLAAPGFDGRIVAPLRREPGIADPRLVVLRADLGPDAEDGLARALAAAASRPLHAYVSCLGTTIRAAGSREAFAAVDRELVLRLARLARERGARHAVLVSSVGANARSGNFYLRVKGEVEAAIAGMGFARVDLLQPGLLIGPRAERRPAEQLMQSLAPLTNALLPGGLRRYRSIGADEVARAIVALLGEDRPGVFTHQWRELRALASGAPASR